jgi:hypothetical protein
MDYKAQGSTSKCGRLGAVRKEKQLLWIPDAAETDRQNSEI